MTVIKTGSIKFNFISSYRGMVDYGIQAYNDLLDGKRIEHRAFADPLFDQDGKRQFNYTPEEYKRMVLSTVGYLYRLNGSVDLPFSAEYARVFNQQKRDEYQAGLKRWTEKYPDDLDIYTKDGPTQAKGTCWLVHMGPGEWDLAWAFATL